MDQRIGSWHMLCSTGIQNVKRIPAYKPEDYHDNLANKSRERNQWVKSNNDYSVHTEIDRMDWSVVVVRHKLVEVAVQMVYMIPKHHQYGLLDRNRLVHGLQLDTMHLFHKLDRKG